MDSLGCELLDSGYMGRINTTIIHPFFVHTPFAGEVEVEARYDTSLRISTADFPVWNQRTFIHVADS